MKKGQGHLYMRYRDLKILSTFHTALKTKKETN